MLRSALKITILPLFSLFLATGAMAAQYRWSDVDRIVAISDPHGAYSSMEQTLANAGVIDADGNWSGGTTHLVITGDLLDRGAESRMIMDLVMRLESQAPQSGGMVLLTLGNHEVMNLVGDLRYVASAEYAAFAEEESAEERERWYQIFLSVRRAQSLTEVDEDELRQEFERDRPPGFYGHRHAFSSEGKYGRWLMQKPLMVVVNDSAFVHGGLPPIVGEMGLDRLNDELRAQVNDYIAALEVLYDAGLIDPAVNFYEHGNIADGIATDASLDSDLLAALDNVARLNEAVVHDTSGPLWYRGSVGCSALAEGDVIAASLNAIGASRVVIGHTPTVTRKVLERMNGRVVEIDTGILSSVYKGSGHALIIENDQLAVVAEAGGEPSAPVPHPRRVGSRADELSAEILTDLLANGTVDSSTTDLVGRTIVEISGGGKSIKALFAEGPRKKDLNPELAAYRLDRLIGLDMVPVTVARELDGKRGTLQFLPDNARDELYRSQAGQGGGAWCPLQRQWNSMYVFDLLIYNEGRAPTKMVYSPENWQLMLMQNDTVFGTGRGRPKYLAEAQLTLTSTWLDALTSISDDVLTENLSDVLSKRQISALGKRRSDARKASAMIVMVG
jgi:hypothetical protein